MKHTNRNASQWLLLAFVCYSTTSLGYNSCLPGNDYPPGSSCEVARAGYSLLIKNASDSDTIQVNKVSDGIYAVHVYVDNATGDNIVSCKEGKIQRVSTFRWSETLESSTTLTYPYFSTLPNSLQKTKTQYYLCNSVGNWDPVN